VRYLNWLADGDGRIRCPRAGAGLDRWARFALLRRTFHELYTKQESELEHGICDDGPMAIPMWINGHAFLTVTEDFFTFVTNPQPPAKPSAACRCAVPAKRPRPCRRRTPRSAGLGRDGHAGRRLPERKPGGLELELCRPFRQAARPAKPASTSAADEVAARRCCIARHVPAVAAGVFRPGCSMPRATGRLCRSSGAGLMAGPPVVVKPSPKAPSAVFALCRAVGRADWPAGVLNLLQGDAIEGLCIIDRLRQCGAGAQVGAIAEAAGKPFEMVAA
jgi:succinate-semialdehyde dehydrogenase/glutarate-semialdehyde dehydrogenase